MKTIFHHGNIISMHSNTPSSYQPECCIFENDTIIFIGSLAYARSLPQQQCQWIDLKGKTLLPGIIDAHSHFHMQGDVLNSLDISPNSISTIEQLQAKLQSASRSAKKNVWINGFGYDDTKVQDMRHLHKNDLDPHSPHHPVIFRHASGHVMYLNTKALDIMGIDAHTPSPDGGTIHKDTHGNPTGQLDETAMFLVMSKLPKKNHQAFTNDIQSAYHDYIENGITTAQDAFCNQECLDLYKKLHHDGLLPMRVVAFPDVNIAMKTSFSAMQKAYNARHFHIGCAKFFSDGSIQAKTAYLSKPYYKSRNGYRGYPTREKSVMTSMIRALYQNGWQVAIHANGDAAIEEVIDSHIEVQKTHPSYDMRHQVIHAQTASYAHLQSMLEHDLTPTFFSNHIKYWGDRHYEMFLGPKRAQRISPAKEAQDIGLAYTLHTDTPITPINPFQLMHSAVERRTPKGRVLGKKLRISRYQALYAITHMAAWQVHLEHLVGSISPGKQADFVITDKNPLDLHTDLQDVQVLETYIAGKRVYAKSNTQNKQKAA